MGSSSLYGSSVSVAGGRSARLSPTPMLETAELRHSER